MDIGHEGYHRIFNNAGWAALARRIDMPDAALGIGFAEVLAPIPLQVRLEPAGIIKLPKTTPILTVEQTRLKGQGKAITDTSFTHSGYMGEGIGGF